MYNMNAKATYTHSRTHMRPHTHIRLQTHTHTHTHTRSLCLSHTPAHLVSISPLEVIKQGPREVPSNVDAAANGRGHVLGTRNSTRHGTCRRGPAGCVLSNVCCAFALCVVCCAFCVVCCVLCGVYVQVCRFCMLYVMRCAFSRFWK